MKTKLVHFIAKQLPAEGVPVVEPPAGTVCAFSGEPLTAAVLLKNVVKSATANLADTFRFPSQYVSVATATCFKASRELRGNLFITESGIQRPMISAKSGKTANRPVWRDLLREYLSKAYPSVCIVTDESKRRLWIDAVVTEGRPLHLYFNSADTSQNQTLDPDRFSECLDHVQTCLTLRFTKRAIANSLFLQTRRVQELGVIETRVHENVCVGLRELPEFRVALMIGTVDDPQN